MAGFNNIVRPARQNITIYQPTTIESLKKEIDELKASGIGGETLGHNTVGTNEIADGSIQLEDMNPNTTAISGDIDEIFGGNE